MTTLRFSGNISAEATTQSGNILPEAMRGLRRYLACMTNNFWRTQWPDRVFAEHRCFAFLLPGE